MSVPPTRIVPVHGTRAGAVPPAQRMRLGDALVRGGVITEAELERCLQVQRGTVPHRRLGEVVVDLGLASEEDVARGLAQILGFEYVDPAGLDVPPEAVRRLPREIAAELRVVPIGAGATWIRLAVADPSDRDMVDAIRRETGLLNVSLAVATPALIAAALERFWSEAYVPLHVVPAAAPPEPTPAPGWEYQVAPPDVAALNALGAQGWEAVGVLPGPAVLLKRRA